MSAAACKFCGSDRGFREYGKARCSTSRVTRSFKTGDDGKPEPVWGSLDAGHGFDGNFDPEGVECRECGRDAATVGDLIGTPVRLEPGARVVLPDGLRATVASVDPDA